MTYICVRAFYFILVLFLFFFFQAEDGIRDIGVTGVQTCALPICGRRPPAGGSPRALAERGGGVRRRRLGGRPGDHRGRLGRHARRADLRASRRDRKSGVEGKSVDLGGRRIIDKKSMRTDSLRDRK